MNLMGALYLLSNGNSRKHSSRKTYILSFASYCVFIVLKVKKYLLKITFFSENNPVLYSPLKCLSVNFHPTRIVADKCKILAKYMWIFMKSDSKFVESKQGIVVVQTFVAKFSHILLKKTPFDVSRDIKCSPSNGLI